MKLQFSPLALFSTFQKKFKKPHFVNTRDRKNHTKFILSKCNSSLNVSPSAHHSSIKSNRFSASKTCKDSEEFTASSSFSGSKYSSQRIYPKKSFSSDSHRKTTPFNGSGLNDPIDEKFKNRLHNSTTTDKYAQYKADDYKNKSRNRGNFRQSCKSKPYTATENKQKGTGSFQSDSSNGRNQASPKATEEFKSKKKFQYSKSSSSCSSSSGTHRSFKEMIQWRKSRESLERLERNKKLTVALNAKVGPQYQLANLQSFSCPAVKEADMAQTWDQLGLSEDLCRGLTESLNLKSPLSTQIVGIPILMNTKPSSILFASQTGSGKTLTYLLPLIHHLKAQEAMDTDATIQNGPKNSPRAVILVPTHELIRQVHRQAKLLSHFAKLKVESADTIKVDDYVDIIISTPRSLLRAVNESRLIKLNLADRIVIDEADTLFATGFHQEIKNLLQLFTNRKSLVATSATIPRQLQRALKTNFPDLQIHVTQGLHAPVSTVRQRFITINEPGNAKSKQCLQILMENPTSRFLVFCNKLAKAESLHKFLSDALLAQHPPQQDENLNTNSFVLPSMFHGNLPPVQRASIMKNFASGAIKVLICTDLAARGLDTSWVNHVINFDFPRSIQDYLHRIGRTARAGRGGVATSFVTGKDRALYEYIQLGVKQNRVLSQPLPLK